MTIIVLNWVLDPELALIDTIFSKNLRLYEIIYPNIVELNNRWKVFVAILPNCIT
jgi:hypothetical protein